MVGHCSCIYLILQPLLAPSVSLRHINRPPEPGLTKARCLNRSSSDYPVLEIISFILSAQTKPLHTNANNITSSFFRDLVSSCLHYCWDTLGISDLIRGDRFLIIINKRVYICPIPSGVSVWKSCVQPKHTLHGKLSFVTSQSSVVV